MKLHLTLSAALIGLVSCTASLVPETGKEVDLSVGVKSTSALTKSTVTGTTDENKVSSVQVFVFKVHQGTYVFEASAKAEASKASVTVTTGDKDVILIVNENTDYTAVTDRGTLLSKVSSLAGNTPSSFVMIGETEATVTTTEHTLDIPVDRMASRVRISKITNKLRNGHANNNVKVSRVYLTGARATAPYSTDGTPTGFYATTGINSSLDLDGNAVGNSEKTAVNALIYTNISSDILADGSSYSTPVSLYAYPNDNSVRKTHVVVEMEIGGKYYTYPVELPPMGRNCSCEIAELVISSIGNVSDGDDLLEDDEDEPITFLEASFNVTVKPWTEITVSNTDDGKYSI